MKKFLTNLGRFTTKLVSLLVICGFISLACLPIVYALNDDDAVAAEIPEGCNLPTEGEQPGNKTRSGSGEEAEDQIDDKGQTSSTTETPVTPPSTTEEEKGSETTSGSTTEEGATSSEEGDDNEENPDESGTPVKYTVTLKYSSTEEADGTLLCEAGEHHFAAKEIAGYTAKDKSITAKIGEGELNVVVFSYEKDVVKVMGKLTIEYKYKEDGTDKDGTEAAPTHTEDIEVGNDFDVDSPVIENYTPSQANVSGEMVEGGVSITVTYSPTQYEIKIHYQDTDGDTISPTETVERVAGSYEVTPKTINGYITPDPKPVNVPEDKEVTFVYGRDTTVPEPTKYTITIQYHDEDGKELLPDKTEKYVEGLDATIHAETIDGYETPKSETLKVTEDDTITFVYKKIITKAILTIHYEYADKTKAADDYIEELEIGKTYTIASPKIPNFTADQATITGEMVAGGATHTVTYTRNSPDQPTEYTITIHYKDADGKEIAASTTEVRAAGEHTFNPKKISGYKEPISQTINVVADTSVTFTYEKDPTSKPDQPGDEPSADEPGSDDPKDPTNSDNQDPNGQNPANQQPADQKPNNQQSGTQTPTITLPVTGPSDELIRNFLVLDAEVSTGGIGLWAISGIIRKIRRR